MAEFKLENYGRALRDVEKSLVLMPGNAKAHYRYAMLNTTAKGKTALISTFAAVVSTLSF